ncbi:hypothetical protein ACH4MG_27465 [Streptomyces sp. NPDC017454]|uniref:hypothetical protein n=1 Tax=Streptomyces sp. NPDC017454 TaxID=3364997 RepID=UPI0037B36C13
MIAPSGRPHGHAKYHLEGCRCLPCRVAASAYDRNRRRAIAYGRWQPFVDAEPVRQHVRALGEFGIGWMRLARLAGVSTGGLSKLLYGDRPRGLAPTKRVRPETALKILAVEPVLENLGDRTAIDGTGTRRRLQALVCAGWPQSELARRMCMDRGNFARTIDRSLVEVGTHKTACTLYDQLWRTDPAEAGIPAHRAQAARGIAAARGWAPVGAWDDDRIDDPEAFPDWTGHCGTPRGRTIHYRIKIPVCQPCRQAAQQLAAA